MFAREEKRYKRITSFSVIFWIAWTGMLSCFCCRVESHSWADCVDWRPHVTDKAAPFGAGDGKCYGWARRFPYKADVPFAYLDSASPNRHYDQGDPSTSKGATAPACSDGVHGQEPGADETMSHPVSLAYTGTWGAMTVKTQGDTMCIRWPANNHAVASEKDWLVRIGLSGVNPLSDPPQSFFNNQSNIIATMPFKNCAPLDKSARDATKIQPCGGCFTIPPMLQPGMYVMQWRWRLNTPPEWYTSCLDIKILAAAPGGAALPASPSVPPPASVSAPASSSSRPVSGGERPRPALASVWLSSLALITASL